MPERTVDLLIAGKNPPRPEVYLQGSAGDLTAPLADFTRRLGLMDVIRTVDSPAAFEAQLRGDGFDLAVRLPETDEERDRIRELETAGIPVMNCPFSLPAIHDRLDSLP